MMKKKIWANIQRIIELFTQKIANKLSKICVWDPWSGKNPFRIPDPQHRSKMLFFVVVEGQQPQGAADEEGGGGEDGSAL